MQTVAHFDDLLATQQAALVAQVWGARQQATTSRKEESMLEKLKNLSGSDCEGTVEALVELAAYGRGLRAEFEAQGVPAPKWLGDNLRILVGRIKAAYRQQQEEKLRKVEKEIEELRSKEEKKQAKEREAAELRKALELDTGEIEA